MAASNKVRPVAGNIGAEISGVDLAGDLEDAVIVDIRRACSSTVSSSSATLPRRAFKAARRSSAYGTAASLSSMRQ